MPSLATRVITEPRAEFDAAVSLFDEYRQFYGLPSDPERCRIFLQERLTRCESTLLMTTVNGQPAGLAQLYGGFSSLGCCKTVILNDLYVRPEYRRAGIGQRLIEASIQHARRTGAANIQLETAQDNLRAQALYERLGFERASGFLPYMLRLDQAEARQ